MIVNYQLGQHLRIGPKAGASMLCTVIEFNPHDGGIGRPCAELKVLCLENGRVGRKGSKTHAQARNTYTFLCDLYPHDEGPTHRSVWWRKGWPRVWIKEA